MSNITSYQKDNLYKGLGLFIDFFREYVVSVLVAEAGEEWPDKFVESLGPQQQEHWKENMRSGSAPRNLIDFSHLTGFALRYKALLRGDFGKSANNLPTWLTEIAAARHPTAHFDSLGEDAATKAWIHMIAIAHSLKNTELEEELKKLREAKEEKQAKAAVNVTGPQPWFRVATPHLDIRQGRLDESVFAANLAEVALDTGNSIYSNPALFFSKTYFTQGLKTIAKRVIKGLNGQEDAENRVISLQTGFGGGKTHTLISLYHICKWGKDAKESSLATDLLKTTGDPEFDNARIAVFTNTTNDPANGRTTEDGVHINTVWGELAYQLGGKKAYEIVRKNDEEKVAPAGMFKKVLEQCKPALILIDELADYCVKAGGVMVGKVSLADMTISFMQELTEAVAATEKCVLVVTLPASPQEVGNTPEAQAILNSLQKRVSRVGADTQPVADEEIYEVIRRRLFEDLDTEQAVKLAVDEYAMMYNGLMGELPPYALKSDYRQKMLKAYPFHPELIDIFRIRWASNHDFQRTRGVLRLLAAIVSDLWKRQQALPGSNLLIHPSDINFSNLDALSGQVKKLYGNGYDAVITADVSGSSSNAFKIDNDKKEYGDWYLAEGIAAVILMNSFGSDGANKGVSTADIKLQVLKPNGFNHNSVNGALDQLENQAHYLYYSTSGQKRYWFNTKPNINILINQAKSDVNIKDIEAEIINRLKAQTNNLSLFGRAIVAPDDDIAEQQRPTLVILGPAHFANPELVNGKTKPLIEKLATKKGNSERIYRNTMLFLLCSEMGYSKLQSDVRDFLACNKINSDYSGQLEKEQKDDIKRKIEESSRQVNTAIVSAYSIVVKYCVKKGIDKILIKEFANSIESQISNVIVSELKKEEWLLDGVGLNILRNNNLLPSPGKAVKAKDAYDAFLRYDDKPMITGVDAIQKSLQRYCTNGEFAIATGNGVNFTEHFFKKVIPFFDILDETYWLVDKEDIPVSTQDAESASNKTAVNAAFGDRTAIPDGTDNTSVDGSLTDTKKFKAVTVWGKIPLEHYTQVFTSFIQPLIHNNVEIEIRIKGKTTAGKTLTESSPEYKIVKESARQLGLNFEEE